MWCMGGEHLESLSCAGPWAASALPIAGGRRRAGVPISWLAVGGQCGQGGLFKVELLSPLKRPGLFPVGHRSVTGVTVLS